ncbi:MAG: anthranilate phosphoribosyltransferase [Miniphocaeibacter sp.]|uniref:anthranilate phosphoribosyltransferase n=1 Tax=Miniphocaeibacter sp. TaxID=3100973 RepID=UPI001851E928|nr:anthranilate phosphoribosyltransferase [Gallicola sp.]
MIEEAIQIISNRKDLSYKMTKEVMDEIMTGKASEVQISSYITGLAIKGETVEEITGSAAGMRKHCVKLLNDKPVLEIVGTGGDRANTFNISTTSSIVISAAGIPVAKHGNRASSSKCGAADVVEALGANLNISPEHSKNILDKIGFCFLFAQNYHIAMKFVAPVRKELAIRSIFNIIGPLANPAGASMQVLGVYDESLVKPMAKVLSNLGVEKGIVVYGQDGLDELSLSSPTTICKINHGKFEEKVITPESVGLIRCKKEDLIGGTPKENAKITMDILEGKKGPKRDAVILNSAAGIHVAKPELSLLDSIDLASRIIDSGKAYKQLEDFINLTKEMKYDIRQYS